ncbi:MAG TPA: winged helix-turn-helix domain-containing protein, partial [Tahibacter sp.]|nr:winged helix-turn-helix domain-containing protein [Tahibacter sp.]
MPTPIYRFGAFRLDPQARELTENGARVNLRISTIDCLIHLVRHRDRPVGRDELASAVWGRVDVSEVSLTHAIMSLRRTLGDTGNEQRAIRTVPRVGYRWVLDGTVEETPDAAPVAAIEPV